jgi:hypothetical protein
VRSDFKINPFKILQETKDYWVIDKAPGTLVIPGREGHQSVEPVLCQWLELETHQKPYVVHRIDKETSGLVLVAKILSFIGEPISGLKIMKSKKPIRHFVWGGHLFHFLVLNLRLNLKPVSLKWSVLRY